MFFIRENRKKITKILISYVQWDVHHKTIKYMYYIVLDAA